MSYTNYQQEEQNTIGILSLLWHVAFLRMHGLRQDIQMIPQYIRDIKGIKLCVSTHYRQHTRFKMHVKNVYYE